MILQATHVCDLKFLVCRSSGSENSMVVVTKDAKSQQATNKMREELERVNSDLATAMKGLQEVSAARSSGLQDLDLLPAGLGGTLGALCSCP